MRRRLLQEVWDTLEVMSKAGGGGGSGVEEAVEKALKRLASKHLVKR
ncbi:MAG: hypothetical protein QW429_02435 [Thermoprotei archaeon]